jgi:predicted N-acetyltransferase YhbS
MLRICHLPFQGGLSQPILISPLPVNLLMPIGAPPMTELALMTLIPLDRVDPAEVERVLDAAFGPGRYGRTAYAIRAGTEWLPALSFAALDEQNELTGTIQAWPVALTTPEGKTHPLIMVGPVAIMPGRQGQGFGRALMAAQAQAIDAVGDHRSAALPQVLIGDAPYYGRFGFVEAPRGWICPGPWDPARLLVRGVSPAVLPQEGMLGPWVR